MAKDRFDEILKALQNMATKDDLAGLATKDDLVEVKTEVLKLTGKVDNLQNRQDVYAGLDRRVDKIDSEIVKIKEKVGIS